MDKTQLNTAREDAEMQKIMESKDGDALERIARVEEISASLIAKARAHRHARLAEVQEAVDEYSANLRKELAGQLPDLATEPRDKIVAQMKRWTAELRAALDEQMHNLGVVHDGAGASEQR